jgi:hypothetical protein
VRATATSEEWATATRAPVVVPGFERAEVHRDVRRPVLHNHGRYLAEVYMWQDLFVLEVPLVEKVIRIVLVYALLLVLIRLAGKRGLAAVNTSRSWWRCSWRRPCKTRSSEMTSPLPEVW